MSLDGRDEAEAHGAGLTEHLPSFQLQGKHRRRPGFVKRHSPGEKGTAAAWEGTGRITKDFGEGDGLDGTHFVIAVDADKLQLPIVEFNLPFHITCDYTAAGKGKLLTNTRTDKFQIFLGEHPWVEANLFPISLHKHSSRALHRCAGESQGCAETSGSVVTLPCPQGCRGVWWLSAPSAGSGWEAEPLPQQSWHRITTTFQLHFHPQANPLLENYSKTSNFPAK